MSSRTDAAAARGAAFPARAVDEALAVEQGLQRGPRRVLEGTAHHNTAVVLTSWPGAVVVRRPRRDHDGMERGTLDETAVLQTIGAQTNDVHVPRVLATGHDALGRYVIHTFEPALPQNEDLTEQRLIPSHPTRQLYATEWDGLLGQLVALTTLDLSALAQVPPSPQEFFDGLRAELVRIVASFPRSVRDQYAAHSLPGAGELESLLSPLRITPRTPSLLHGDLHPWNLVCLPGGHLCLIDWQLATIGDPLYDLVRHFHLTRSTSRRRKAMFDQWAKRLPEDRTTGWRQDAPLYARLEQLRSAYIDLARIHLSEIDAPNVASAVTQYSLTLSTAHASLWWLTHRPHPSAAPSPALAR
ncbi:phosphotransferase family protein [Streptomyces sp. NPDC088768]|uniref:phosphotransferase family protein n=1 Tax=Streptomyces sp. NPDC088768 TaxID=3365894 RepID=UPI00382B8A87